MTIAHLTVATRDVPRTAAFFVNTLGWQALHQAGNIATEAAWLQIDPQTQLHILHVADFEASPFEREYGRHVAVFHDAEDWQGLQDRLVQAGAELVEPLRETPFPRFFFRDFNGYLWEVIDRKRFVQE